MHMARGFFSVLRVLFWLFFASLWQGCTSKQPSVDINTQDERRFTPLNYDENFAYGCLHEIPIPHYIPDEMFTLQQEKDVLIEIYEQTSGLHWKNSTGWRKNGSDSHCTWYGVTCHNGTGHVIVLFLTNNNLTGTLPGSLWRLRNLQGMCMASNPGLTGQLKDFLSPNMTNLLRLRLAYNKHSGGIPGEILVKMKSLVKIQLSGQIGRELNGTIPEDIGNLTELQVLSLGENILTGPIPKSISKLKKLWFLDFQTTKQLTGGIENLYEMYSIRFMHLSFSGLGGTLPDEFGTYFPSMLECLLTENNFTGPIPSSIGEMKKLLHLNLAHNKFNGAIPKSLGAAPSLQIIDLTGNELTSFADDFKATSSALELFLLAKNDKNGGLSMKFENLLNVLEGGTNTSLRILNISQCSFYGEISSKLWEFTGFISVDLSANKLCGSLPLPLDNALFLLHLDFSGNDLHGKIPQQFSKLLALQYLDISDNPRMSSGSSRYASPLPNFVEADFSTLHKNPSDNFTCPNARLSYNNGLVLLDPEYYKYRLCLCDIRFYGDSGECLKCMRGATCDDHMLPTSHMTIEAGYWPSPRADNVTHLVRCSEVMGAGYEAICNPSSACDCWIERETAKDNVDAELITVCRNSCICKQGSTDRFCSKCLDGFYKEGSVCTPCADTNTDNAVLATSLVVLSLLVLIVLLFKLKRAWTVIFLPIQVILLAVLADLTIIPFWLFEINTIVLLLSLAGRGKTAGGLAKITLFYVQTLGSLISTAGDIWPPAVTVTQRYISNVFNLHFSGFGCELPALFTPVGRLAFVLLVPIVCICFAGLFYGLACVFLKVFQRGTQGDTRIRVRNGCLQVVITSLNLTYFPIVKKTAAVLAPCKEDGPFSYMPATPWIVCDGHTYNVLSILAYISLVFYVVGVPLALFLPLLSRFASKRDDLDAEQKENMDSWLGSIYVPYKREFRSYFEVFFLLRRMLIAFSLSLISQMSSFQTVAVCSVLLAALSFQLFFRPFESSLRRISLENTVETVVLLVLHFSFMNIRFVSLKPSAADKSLIWLLIAVNGAVIMGLFVSWVIVLGKSLYKPGVQQGDEEELRNDLEGGEQEGPQSDEEGGEQEGPQSDEEAGGYAEMEPDGESESSLLKPGEGTTYGLC